MFSLRRTDCVRLQSYEFAKHYLGSSIPKDLGNMRNYCSSQCTRNVVLGYSSIVSNNVIIRDSAKEIQLTCNETSRRVIWAGLASDMSCAAADVMSDPAD